MVSILSRSVVSRWAPSEWDPMQEWDVRLVELSSSSTEFSRVQIKICSTLPAVTQYCIERVQNPYLWGCYLLKQAEYSARGLYPRELELFHCTSAGNVASIIRDNLDWRRTTRSKFGTGVNFSPSAQYANKYANASIGSSRALILCKVLVGMETCGYAGMVMPPLLYDTSTGNSSKVYVKYCDYEFYPQYVAYYTHSGATYTGLRPFSGLW